MNKMINQNLKKIATLASIYQNLTIYVARHTFANIMKNKGVSNNLISEMMGHDSEATTKIYLQNFSDFDVMNKVYASYFSSTPPARACVEVSKMAKNALVEIDAIVIV